jgi:hypothetical protein
MHAKFFFQKENDLPLPHKINFFTVCLNTAKNTINAELRIDGDFYPCTF